MFFSFLLRRQKEKSLTLGNLSACRITMEINELSSKIIGAAIEVHMRDGIVRIVNNLKE